MRRSLAAMRFYFFFVAVAGCCFCPAPSYADSFFVFRARADIGKSARDLGLPAQKWCADWINKLRGGRDTDRSARSYLKRPRAAACTSGTIAVLTRGKGGGHVGVVESCDRKGNPKLISGNHNGVVGEGVYPRSRVIAWVMP